MLNICTVCSTTQLSVVTLHNLLQAAAQFWPSFPKTFFSCFSSSVELKNANFLVTYSFLTLRNVLSPRLANKRLCPRICATFFRKPLGAALFVVYAKMLQLL